MMRSIHARLLTLTIVAAGLAASVPAGARNPERQGPRAAAGAADDADRDARAERRAQVREKMAAYLTRELASRAALDAQKADKLGIALRAQMERRDAHRREMKKQMKELRALLERNAADGAVRAQLDKVMALADGDERLKVFVEETRAFLTPSEQARVALAFPEVMREGRRLIGEARGGRGQHGGGRGERGAPHGDGLEEGDDD